MQLSGIDKTCISGVSIESVDFEKLEKSGKAVIMRNTDKSLYRLKNGNTFEYIKIRDDNIFKTFQAGFKPKGNMFIYYAFIDLSISPLVGNNLVPLTIGAYRKHLDNVFGYLESTYGVRCTNMDNLKFRTLELNTNIQLDRTFDEYFRVIEILMNIAPRVYKRDIDDKTRLKWDSKNRKPNTVDTFTLKNKSLQVKFYNKSKQLKEVYELDIEKNLLRIEYTFLTDTKIKKVFGSNNINQLTDLQIKNFIINQFINDFAKPYDRLKRENRVELKRLIDKCKSENKNWINQITKYFWNEEGQRFIPTLLDIEDILELVKLEDKVNYAKNKRKILRDFPKIYFNQHEKYEEIFNKVMAI